MRLPVAVLLLLTLSPLSGRAADEPGPAALPHGEGWVSLFEGGDFSGLLIEGDAKVVDGVLVIGGAGPTRLSVNRDLGDDFEVRLFYRLDGRGGMNVMARSSSLMGSSATGTKAPESPAVPGAVPEWRELRCVCRKGAADRTYDIRLESWRDDRPVAANPNASLGGLRGGPPEVCFEVPAGTKLLLRGAAAHPDPTAGSWWRTPWPFAALLAFLVVVAAAVLLFARRMRRRAVAPAAPPLDDLPPDDGL